MNIFYDNQKLEQLAFYAMDWGVFLRKDLSGPFSPFIFMQKGEKIFKKVAVSEGDPLEFIHKIISDSKEDFEQFAYGVEGRTKNNEGQKVDTIIISAFDTCLPNGVMLGQVFVPKETSGTFSLVDRIMFLDDPQLPIPIRPRENKDFEVEEIGFQAMTVKAENDLVRYIAFFTHDSFSWIKNEMKNFLFSRLENDQQGNLSGQFDLIITPSKESIDDFSKDIMVTLAEEIPTREPIKQWEQRTKRKIVVSIKYGDEIISVTKEREKDNRQKFNTAEDWVSAFQMENPQSADNQSFFEKIGLFFKKLLG